LRAQAQRLDPLTARFLAEAGLTPGMRVLELGTGLGHLTALVCARVGPSGCVRSVDRSPNMLEHARQTVWGARADVRFVLADLDDGTSDLDGPFDALVGRLVLTHVADPVATLRDGLRHVRPGGVVAFQEADATVSERLLRRHGHVLPLTCRVCEWIDAARRATAMNPHLGGHLADVFREAGLCSPVAQLHTELYRGACADRIRNAVRMVRELMPTLAQAGVSDEEVGIDTLEQRLIAELELANVVQARTSIASARTTR
jgi:SAM-dependent methyltransferase